MDGPHTRSLSKSTVTNVLHITHQVRVSVLPPDLVERSLSPVKLTSLDMEAISEESKAFANAIFVKKRMYYNMRSRFIKRHAGHVVRKVRATRREPPCDLSNHFVRIGEVT